MFERFTEPARRTLFFARYETSVLGSPVIETEHLLLGLLREAKGLAGHVLNAAGVRMDTIRPEIERRSSFRERVATSVEIPFSQPTKRALQQSALEADCLQHGHIGPEHLLLALLHDPTSVASEVLGAHGLRYDDTLKAIRRLINEGITPEPAPPATPAEVAAVVARIKGQVEQLASLAFRAAPDSLEPRLLAMAIHLELDRLAPRSDT